jgi:hypothetical protein
MEKSETIRDLAAALGKFQAEAPEIELNSEVNVTTGGGGKYSFKYSTLNHVMKVIKPLMAANGLSFSQMPESDNSLTTLLMHTSGQYLVGNKPLDLPDKVKAQEVGSFITYYKRYSLLAMLGIAAEDDEDGNLASGNTAKKTDKPWLNPKTSEWKGALEFLQAGNSIEAIKKKYAISKVNQEKLITEAI